MHYLNSDERADNWFPCFWCDGVVFPNKASRWEYTLQLEGRCSSCKVKDWEEVDCIRFNTGRQEYWDCRIDCKPAPEGVRLTNLSLVA